MTKRFTALLLSLFFLFSAALAEDTIATYELPSGAEVCFVTDAAGWEAPAGLAPMYELMQRARLDGYVYLMRMPNGRALASVSCTWIGKELSAEDLLARWPQIQQNIALEVHSITDAEAKAEARYGVELLHITASLSAGGDAPVPLKAEAFAFCRDEEMYEIWAVQPSDALYLYDADAAAELESDLRDLELFLASLDFSGQQLVAEGYDYADPHGRFTMKMLTDSVVITADTPMEEVSAARERFTAANEAGADRMFDQFMADVYEQQVTLMLTADMKGALLVFCGREEDFAGVTPDMLATLAEPVRKSLHERFGLAMSLAADGRAYVSGAENAYLGYWVRSGDCDAQLDVLACVLGADWLCEADIFTIDGDQELRSILSALVSQTLHYTVQ